jgi:hypothetical protein
VWSTLAIEDWGIENDTRGFLTDPLVDIFAATLLNVEIIDICISNDLANRLHGELILEVTKLAELSIGGAEGSTEPPGIGLEEARDVASNLTPAVAVFLILLDRVVSSEEVIVEAWVLRDD